MSCPHQPAAPSWAPPSWLPLQKPPDWPHLVPSQLSPSDQVDPALHKQQNSPFHAGWSQTTNDAPSCALFPPTSFPAPAMPASVLSLTQPLHDLPWGDTLSWLLVGTSFSSFSTQCPLCREVFPNHPNSSHPLGVTLSESPSNMKPCLTSLQHSTH